MHPLSIQELVDGIRSGDRMVLGKAITLIESKSAADQEQAFELMQALATNEITSVRIGLTGAPGVGKSTFADAFGSHITSAGHKVAVLAVDPSSLISGGSILGDKTRMERLSRDENAFVRPSPAGRSLGGVARRTRETILVCEAAGYDVVIVETVGVGQSEVAVRSMVDFTLLLMQPGSGDELQGIKRGIVELADGILVTKSDGDLFASANKTKAHFESVMRLLYSGGNRWVPPVLSGSAIEGQGIAEAWSCINDYREYHKSQGGLNAIRLRQSIQWYQDLVRELIEESFFSREGVAELHSNMLEEVRLGKISPAVAGRKLMQAWAERLA